MARYVRLREMLVGVEGLALLRHLYDGSAEDAERRIAEVRAILDDDGLAAGEWTREQDSRAGYGAWSASYDEPGNPIVELEQPAMWSLLEGVAPGRALDAACGTGRHTRRLVELGHDVTAVDISPEMLARARENVPQATFVEADVRAMPLEGEQFDLVACALALAHLRDLGAATGELARVLAPGGRLVISVLHPILAQLGWHAPFADATGRRGFVREHVHTHAEYFAALAAAGVTVRTISEPRLGPDQVRAKRRTYDHAPEAALAAYRGLPGVLIWEAEKPPA